MDRASRTGTNPNARRNECGDSAAGAELHSVAMTGSKR